MARRAIDRDIAAIAIPASLALATEPLYALSDTAILGHVGTSALAGAAVATRLLAFGSAAFVFLMFGTTAAVARADGGGDARGADEHGVAAVWLALVLGVATAGAMLLAGPTLIRWSGARGAVADDALTYLTVSAAGLPALTIVFAGVGYLRGRRDTRRPLVVSAATVVLNLVLELALVHGAGWGVAASALGTVVAKWSGAVVYVTLLARRTRRSGAGWRPRRDVLADQLVVGRDLVVRTVVLLGVLTVAQVAATRVGPTQAAGYAVAFAWWNLAAYALDGLEAAGQSLVAHHLGADRLAEVGPLARRVVTWGVRIGLASAAILVIGAGAVPDWFTDDPAVVAAATGSLWWVAAVQPVNGAAFALDGIGVGAGRQRDLAAAMIVAGAAFAAAFAAARAAGATGLTPVWIALTVFMVARALAGAKVAAVALSRS